MRFILLGYNPLPLPGTLSLNAWETVTVPCGGKDSISIFQVVGPHVAIRLEDAARKETISSTDGLAKSSFRATNSRPSPMTDKKSYEKVVKARAEQSTKTPPYTPNHRD